MGLRVVKVPGNWGHAVVGDEHFPDRVAALPVGPLEVTLGMQPNRANPHAVVAYVGGQQVGWLQTDWDAEDKDQFVEWVRKLEAAGIAPCFDGELRDRGEPLGRIINFDMPRRSELSAAAEEAITQASE